jgi:phenylalanyl-tRNA synthetase beta chain
MVVIADENGPESLAGIMGGEHSGCDETTTDVLVESALWDPLNIAQTGRKLGIITDARYRFERGVDPNYTMPGLDLAAHLIGDLRRRDLEVAARGRDSRSEPHHRVPLERDEAPVGARSARAEARTILEQLGFHASGSGDTVKVLPPSWRPDIEGKADLVEEIVRIAGLDRIEPEPLGRIEATVVKPLLTLLQRAPAPPSARSPRAA